MTRSGSLFIYERGDLVETPLGKATILDDPDNQGRCRVKVADDAEVERDPELANASATTFQFGKIIRKWNGRTIHDLGRPIPQDPAEPAST